MADGMSLPQPGDLIEIDRRGYQHWALYMGDGYVIHLTSVGSVVLSSCRMSLLRGHAMVKLEPLKKVVGNDQWCVNNKWDQHRKPFPSMRIIRRAESTIGSVVLYRVRNKSSEHFVTKLRYGVGLFDQLMDFVYGDIKIFDLGDDEEYPKPGDLIEIKQGHYDHWALYVGDGYVIHVAPVDEEAPSLSGSSDTRRMRKAKVKKELLRDVARNKKWSVSNEYDSHIPPLPVEEIIWHAEGCIGKEMEYDTFKFKSVDFLSKLRHVGLFRAFEGGEIHRHDPINRKYLPIPGDLIEIERGSYQHWALYMGHGYVVHVTDVGSTDVSSGSVSSVFGKAMVKKELLEKVVADDEWCVNNKYDKYWESFRMKEIIRRAEGWIGKKVRYRLFRNNCEHFVTMIRYGVKLCDQVKDAFHRLVDAIADKLFFFI